MERQPKESLAFLGKQKWDCKSKNRAWLIQICMSHARQLFGFEMDQISLIFPSVSTSIMILAAKRKE